MKTQDIQEGKIYNHKNFGIIVKKDGEIYSVTSKDYHKAGGTKISDMLLEKNESEEITNFAEFVKNEVKNSPMPSASTSSLVANLYNAEMLIGKRNSGKQLREVANEYGIEPIEPTETEKKWAVILGTPKL